MSSADPTPFPLVEIQVVANALNEWVALIVEVTPAAGEDAGAALERVFCSPDALGAFAPLDCIIPIPTLGTLTKTLLGSLPAASVILALPGAAMAAPGATEQCRQLQADGFRCLFAGPVPAGLAVALPPGALSFDCAGALPGPGQLPALSGPHLARAVDTAERFAQCARAGFGWFAGPYWPHVHDAAGHNDGTSRRRLLGLLSLLASDAESRELEALLKQDPALSYHLFKLVNSAAFAHATPIASFGQAIQVLGRRQLQRWLQLMLYARQHDDGGPNPLLALAARRAAQMESLCALAGGSGEQQDLAFMTGVFSLLEALLAMPMLDIVGAFGMPPDVALALLERGGRLGVLLRLVETPAPGVAALARAHTDPESWWQSLLQAYRWAIHVSQNL